jgi:calcineurin-like phosphoesterase family protein
VYAHVHNNANYKLVSSCGYCTSVEVNDYTPVEMSAIQKLISDERKKIDLSLFE